MPPLLKSVENAEATTYGGRREKSPDKSLDSKVESNKIMIMNSYAPKLNAVMI